MNFSFTDTFAAPITIDPTTFSDFFTGSLGDGSFTAGATSSLTESIYLVDSHGNDVLLDTLVSGPLTAPNFRTPDAFAMGDGPTALSALTDTYEGVLYKVSGTLSAAGSLTFQGGLELEYANVPEPTSLALLLCGLGGCLLLARKVRRA